VNVTESWDRFLGALEVAGGLEVVAEGFLEELAKVSDDFLLFIWMMVDVPM
jgi:hypothetical protein